MWKNMRSVIVLVVVAVTVLPNIECQSLNDSDVESNEYGLWLSLNDIIQNGTAKDFANLVKYAASLNDEMRRMALYYSSDLDIDFITNILINPNSSVDIELNDGWTPLHWASWNGLDDIVEMLLKRGSQVNKVNKFGRTPLHSAAFNGHEMIADMLIHKGANVNLNDSLGVTPMYMAAFTGHDKIVELLLRNDADYSIKTIHNRTAMDIATEKGHFAVLELIKQSRSSFKACQRNLNVAVDSVIDEETVQQEQFPWMAALGYLNERYEIQFLCGGTIVSEYFVLTAAHCSVRDAHFLNPPVVVRLGKLSLTDKDGVKPKNFPIQEIILHPDYSAYVYRHDIALVRVGQRIYFSAKVAPACLHNDLRDIDSNVKLLATGWGRFDLNSVVQSNVLKKIPLKTLPLVQCIANYIQNINVRVLISGIGKGQYCVIHADPELKSCTGDSGGPLQMFRNGTNIPTIVGIVSYGLKCDHDTPTVCTRVAYYLDWIESIVWPRNGTAGSGNSVYVNSI